MTTESEEATPEECCREDADCSCPCLPKCCPNGQVLDHGTNAGHGYRCKDGSDEPEPFKEHSNIIFNFINGSTWPTCLGMPRNSNGKQDLWNYTKHNNFTLKTGEIDFQEFSLYVGEKAKRVIF